MRDMQERRVRAVPTDEGVYVHLGDIALYIQQISNNLRVAGDPLGRHCSVIGDEIAADLRELSARITTEGVG